MGVLCLLFGVVDGRMAKQVAVVRYLRGWNAAADYVYGLTRVE